MNDLDLATSIGTHQIWYIAEFAFIPILIATFNKNFKFPDNDLRSHKYIHRLQTDVSSTNIIKEFKLMDQSV